MFLNNELLQPWASAEIFPGGAKSTFCSTFSGCWRCNANGRTQSASPLLHHKENVQCCGNSYIQCFPSKKILTLSIPRFAIILAQGLQRYNSPADWARKLFKPSTDSASLLVKIEKKLLFVLGLWFSGRGRHKWGCHFHFIGLVYAALDANPMGQLFRSSFYLKLGYPTSL